MNRTLEFHRQKISEIDETIKNYCKHQKIDMSGFAKMLGISESSLRGKRRGNTEFTLLELFKIREITAAKISPLIDERFVNETPEPYKTYSKEDKTAVPDKYLRNLGIDNNTGTNNLPAI